MNSLATSIRVAERDRVHDQFTCDPLRLPRRPRSTRQVAFKHSATSRAIMGMTAMADTMRKVMNPSLSDRMCRLNIRLGCRIESRHGLSRLPPCCRRGFPIERTRISKLSEVRARSRNRARQHLDYRRKGVLSDVATNFAKLWGERSRGEGAGVPSTNTPITPIYDEVSSVVNQSSFCKITNAPVLQLKLPEADRHE